MFSLFHPTPAGAARVLREVFGQIPPALAFRLWDGQEVRLGPQEPVCTAVIKTPETFVRLMRDPSPGNFAEAYVDSAIELEILESGVGHPAGADLDPGEDGRVEDQRA